MAGAKLTPTESEHNFMTTAKQAVVLDYNTGATIFAKNAEEMVPPSSMSKLMTLYVLFNHLKAGSINLTDEFIVSENAWRAEGSRMFLDLDSKITVESLIRGIIVQSGNDACITLAEGVAGSESNFVEQMNATAKKINLTYSMFNNSTGLPDAQHKMSTFDVAKLSTAIIRDFPEYYHYFSEKSFKHNNISQENRNNLLGIYGVDGLKTGHTEEAGYSIALSAKSDKRRLIVVVNGLSTAKERKTEATRLLQHALQHFHVHNFTKKGGIVSSIPVHGGNHSAVKAVLLHDLDIICEKKIKKEDIKFEMFTQEPIYAPIEENSIVGVLKAKIGDKSIQEYNLYAMHSVAEASFFRKFFQNLKYFFQKS